MPEKEVLWECYFGFLCWERDRERGKGKADQGRNETMKVKRTTKKIHQLFFWWKILKLLSNFIIKKKKNFFFERKNYRLKSLVWYYTNK